MPTSHRLRMIAPAVAGVVAATALLSGCLGNDKDDKGSKTPVVPSTASPTGKATTSPTGKPGGTTKPTGTATGTSTADIIDAFTYKTGQCINQDGSKTTDVSCTKPHSGQVGKAFDLPATVTPATLGYTDKVNDLCEQYVGPIVDRQPASPKITFSFSYPLDMKSWNAGNHQAACIIEREDKKPLTTIIK